MSNRRAFRKKGKFNKQKRSDAPARSTSYYFFKIEKLDAPLFFQFFFLKEKKNEERSKFFLRREKTTTIQGRREKIDSFLFSFYFLGELKKEKKSFRTFSSTNASFPIALHFLNELFYSDSDSWFVREITIRKKIRSGKKRMFELIFVQRVGIKFQGFFNGKSGSAFGIVSKLLPLNAHAQKQKSKYGNRENKFTSRFHFGDQRNFRRILF